MSRINLALLISNRMFQVALHYSMRIVRMEIELAILHGNHQNWPWLTFYLDSLEFCGRVLRAICLLSTVD